MKPYGKTQNLFKREGSVVNTDKYSDNVFKVLESIDWEWTEKIDGTNIRLIWDGDQLEMRGRTDRAQLPGGLNLWFEANYKELLDKFYTVFQNAEAAVYGEGYGGKIQKMSNVYGEDQRFIGFDIWRGDTTGSWLPQPVARALAGQLGLDYVPIVGHGDARDALHLVREGLNTQRPYGGSGPAEGIIGSPRNVILRDAWGGRIKWKLKAKDVV